MNVLVWDIVRYEEKDCPDVSAPNYQKGGVGGGKRGGWVRGWGVDYNKGVRDCVDKEVGR